MGRTVGNRERKGSSTIGCLQAYCQGKTVFAPKRSMEWMKGTNARSAVAVNNGRIGRHAESLEGWEELKH